MSDRNAIFGWDLLYRSEQHNIRGTEDVLICFVHLVLIANRFQCIGLGDSKTFEGNEPRSEALPNGWNEVLQLRYVFEGKLYLLLVTKMDDRVMMNLVRPHDRTVGLIELKASFVKTRNGSLDEMIPNNKQLIAYVVDQFIDKMKSSKSKDATSQTTSHQQRRILLQHSDMNIPVGNPHPIPLRIDPVGVGRADLDPLAGMGGPRFGGLQFPPPVGGGGMLFQPPRRQDFDRHNLPPGAIPPGARFDPFRPPDADRPFNPRRYPDNDEMPPPGFDDMYM